MNLFGLILMHCFIKIFYTVAQSFLFNILSVNVMLFVHHYSVVADKCVYGFGFGAQLARSYWS
jgi:hypothetical protein